VLKLSKCSRLPGLPDSIGALTGLRVLCLERCSGLQQSQTALTGLKVLDLKGCKGLRTLPSGLGALPSLDILDVANCTGMPTMPACILHLPQSCRVNVNGWSLKAQYCIRGKHQHGLHRYHDVEEVTVSDLQAAHRRAVVLQRLLGDRDARQQALENLSIVAVLLATAAFVAFAQTPQPADAFSEADDAHEGDGWAPEHPQWWLRQFFRSVQAAFVLSMAVVIFVLVSSVPEIADKDKLVRAGRVWLGFALLSLLLFLAVVCGLFAFVAGAYAVYPSKFVESDVRGLAVLSLVIAGWAFQVWVASLWRIFPWVACNRSLSDSLGAVALAMAFARARGANRWAGRARSAQPAAGGSASRGDAGGAGRIAQHARGAA
jgi:Domain of unknown function